MTVSVTMVDGPCNGRTVKYGTPLPMVLVIAHKTVSGPRWHDYIATSRGDRYRHSPTCKCHYQPLRPVELDA